MTARLLLTIAWRNLWRHTRRTLLTALAFAAGVFLLIVFLGLTDGMHEKMIETGVRLGSGHVVVEPQGARKKVATNLVFDAGAAAAVRDVLASSEIAPYIKGSAPRLIALGLLSSATNATGVQVVGTDPLGEEGVSLLPARVIAGTFLGPDPSAACLRATHRQVPGTAQAGGATPPVVVGRILADKLNVATGAKVVLMTQAGSEIQSQLLRVRGVFKTGLEDADGHLIAVPLGDLQALLARPGALSEQAIFLHRGKDAERVRDLIRAGLRQAPVSVLTWREAMPQLHEFVVIDDASNLIFCAVVLVMVTLGVLNTILMSVLERRREFGLLTALGMRPFMVSAMVTAETLCLSALGAAVGLATGLAAHRYYAEHGFDISLLSSQNFTVAGVAIDTIVKSYLYPGRIPWSLAFIAALGMLAAVYPAFRAARTLPTEATRGL